MITRTINRYLPNLKVARSRINTKRLPLFLKEIYSFEILTINNIPYLLVNVLDHNLGPRDFKKHAKAINQKIELPLIWYLSELHYHKIRRMIQNGMDFVVGEKQLHLPSISISLQLGKQTAIPKDYPFNSLAINVLIREILREDLSGKIKQEIAAIFGVNPMAISRAIKALIQNSLCADRKVATSKVVQFAERSELIAFLKSNVATPIKEIVYLDKLPKTDLPFSGISAISRLSMLADDEIPTFAIQRRIFNKEYDRGDNVFEEFAECRIELWDRKPLLLKDGIINSIDIYLVHKHNKDQRVQIELEKLLKEIGVKL